MTTNYKDEKERIALTLDAKFAERIRERFEQKSVIRSSRILAERLKIYSWGINALSFALALYAVYYFTSLYGSWKFFALFTLGVVLLALWELAKRESIILFSMGVFNQEKRGNLAMGFVVLFLIGVSMTTTYYGGNKLVVEENNGPEQVHSSAIDSLSVLLSKAEADKELMKSQTWNGVIVRDARKQMSGLQERIDVLLSQKMELEQSDRDENGELKAEHESKMANLGIVFGGLGVLFDLVLIGFLSIAEKKEWEVFCLENNRPAIVPKRTVPVPKRSKNGTDNRSNISKDKGVTVPKIAAEKRSIGFFNEQIKIENKRSCLTCGTDISNRRSDAKFCSPSCRKDYWEMKNKKG